MSEDELYGPDEDWANIAKQAQREWAKENPTSNRPQTYTITDDQGLRMKKENIRQIEEAHKEAEQTLERIVKLAKNLHEALAAFIKRKGI